MANRFHGKTKPGVIGEAPRARSAAPPSECNLHHHHAGGLNETQRPAAQSAGCEVRVPASRTHRTITHSQRGILAYRRLMFLDGCPKIAQDRSVDSRGSEVRRTNNRASFPFFYAPKVPQRVRGLRWNLERRGPERDSRRGPAGSFNSSRGPVKMIRQFGPWHGTAEPKTI